MRRVRVRPMLRLTPSHFVEHQPLRRDAALCDSFKLLPTTLDGGGVARHRWYTTASELGRNRRSYAGLESFATCSIASNSLRIIRR